MTFIPESLKQIDFLVQATGDIYNPTGIITPITEAAFEYIHDSGLEFVSYNITDANGYCVSRQDFEQYVEIIEDHFSVFLYHPEYGVAELEAVQVSPPHSLQPFTPSLTNNHVTSSQEWFT